MNKISLLSAFLVLSGTVFPQFYTTYITFDGASWYYQVLEGHHRHLKPFQYLADRKTAENNF